jgi:outer membrane murein-binding lipoprotein Lpp
LKAFLARTLALAAAAVALMAIAGCGSNSGADSASATTIQTSSIPKARFVSKANAICKHDAARLLENTVAFQKAHIDVVSRILIPKIVREVIRPELLEEIEQIRSLGAPHGDAAELEKFFSTLLHGTDEIVAEKLTTLDEAEGLLLPAGDLARRYGLEECRYPLVEPS